MAKSRFHTPRELPFFNPQLPPIGSAAPTLSGVTLDAVGEKVAMIGRMRWADGATHDLRSLRWRSATGNLNGTLQVSARDVDTANGPPARDDGTADQSVDHTNPNQNTNFTSTLGSDRTSVTHGALLAIVFEVTARTSGSFQILTALSTAGGQHGHPVVSSFTGSVWASENAIPLLTLVAADGTLGVLAGSFPQLTATTSTANVNSGTAGADEYALKFTPTEPCWAGEFHVTLTIAAGADFDVILYEGTTALVTVSIDANVIDATGSPCEFFIPFTDVELTPGTAYRLAIKPTTANNVTIYLATITSGDAELVASGCQLSTRVDAGSWTDDATRVPLRFCLGIVASDDGAGGGSGFQPTLRAGMM